MVVMMPERVEVAPEDFVLDREGFREWLLSKDEEEVVGYQCVSIMCPIAAYIGSVTEDVVSVGIQEYFMGECSNKKSPKWVSTFVCLIDIARGGPAVKAGSALDILDGIAA